MVTFYKKKKKLTKLFPCQEVFGCFLNPFFTSWLSSFATPKGYFLTSKNMALFHCYFANAAPDKPQFIVFYYFFFYGVNVNLSESIRSKMSEVVLNSTLRSEM